MTIDSMGSVQAQTQMQIRKMDGSGGGQGGGNGLKDVMQNLSSEDRTTLQNQLSGMSNDDKKIAKEQMKSIDATNLSSEDYLSALLSAMGTEDTSSTTTNQDGFITEIYA